MSEVRPQTLDEMLNISGVGQFKLEKYGEKFLESIKSMKNKKDRELKEEMKWLSERSVPEMIRY